MVVGISLDRLDSVWHHVVPLLQQALDFSDYPYPVEHFKDLIEKREAQLWMTHDEGMIWVTQILVYPRYKLLSIMAGAGTGLENWIEESDALFTAYAKYHGCKYVEGQGRHGWEKPCRKLGYKPAYYVIRKEV